MIISVSYNDLTPLLTLAADTSAFPSNSSKQVSLQLNAEQMRFLKPFQKQGVTAITVGTDENKDLYIEVVMGMNKPARIVSRQLYSCLVIVLSISLEALPLNLRGLIGTAEHHLNHAVKALSILVDLRQVEVA